MKPVQLVLLFTAVAVSAVVAAQSSPQNNWVGIWQADSDGLRTSTLTLATDTGQLGGTIVLDMLSRDGGHAHVVASEPHVLVNLRADQTTMSFDVKMARPG